MRTLPLLAVLLSGCMGSATGSHVRPPPKPQTDGTSEGIAAPPSPSATASASTGQRCIIVGEREVVVEGTLRAGSGGLLTLRLARPRCAVGLPRAGFLTEVAVATAGPDLRPLVDAQVRLEGEAIAGENDMGGPAIVILVRDVARIVPSDDD